MRLEKKLILLDVTRGEFDTIATGLSPLSGCRSLRQMRRCKIHTLHSIVRNGRTMNEWWALVARSVISWRSWENSIAQGNSAVLKQKKS
jgi:hypothetical protein